ncbi:hypothetical protein AB0D38_23595 [Streptomyces sp. NPDC048279]|uniref:hypothetical protein n=1 Tax=Streptomyces sp. NPDC048279 TaxID=3154714 RepID=UPI003440B4F7
MRPAAPDIDPKGLSAHHFLARAADALDKQPAGTEPTGKQWIYTNVVPVPDGRTSERLVRCNGEPQACHPAAGDTRPADGEGTLRALRDWNAVSDDGMKGPGGQAWDDYREISALLGYRPMPPAALASLYRALALPVKGNVTDHLVDTVTGRKPSP